MLLKSLLLSFFAGGKKKIATNSKLEMFFKRLDNLWSEARVLTNLHSRKQGKCMRTGEFREISAPLLMPGHYEISKGQMGLIDHIFVGVEN